MDHFFQIFFFLRENLRDGDDAQRNKQEFKLVIYEMQNLLLRHLVNPLELLLSNVFFLTNSFK